MVKGGLESMKGRWSGQKWEGKARQEKQQQAEGARGKGIENEKRVRST